MLDASGFESDRTRPWRDAVLAVSAVTVPKFEILGPTVSGVGGECSQSDRLGQ
ncbi:MULTISPECIES: hypothetical protein [unclassified Rhodococcus (in: high G+C Gram-positive bacteria)]|uniref:hypothetical protein n=1 Tax=unclassified Rhodococcus (in: high G+C Gram-positive bacteria) TaxID=192944 RepID=UPI0033962339